MKMKKRILVGLTSAAIAASMFAVSANAAKEGFKEIEPTAENVKMIGRTSYENGTLSIPWSAGGVEFKTTGSMVRFNLKKTDTTRIAVYVNGKLAVKGYTDSKSKNPVIDVPLEEGENTVKLVKLSECANSILKLESIEVEEGATVTPTDKQAHSIEFIGDSITCGYGVDGDTSESFNVKNENAAKTYAYLTADTFDADYSFVSVSGTGVISGYTANDSKNESNLAPTYYESLYFSWGGNNSTWDFAGYQPEAIVINLGTNDSSYTKGNAEKCKDFQDTYVQFIKTVRKNNPNSAIICSLGVMGQDLYPQVEAAVDAYKTETGETNVYAFKFNVQDTTNNGIGVDWHPSEQSHKDAAGELEAFISETLGWSASTSLETGMENTVKDDDKVFADADAGETTEDPSSSESSSEVQPDSSSQTDDSSDESSKNSSEASSSSKASSSTAAATNNAAASNPATGVVIALAGAALAGTAVVVSRKKK
ncbi:MAG: GDSL family lipase [Ruminococcus sp.]|nr:GDSL family lipase [Ruminococcus sp.]